MNKKLYSDLVGQYMLIDYHPSHSQILIRRKMDKTLEHNIDLIFKSVINIQIPTRFDGINISVIDNKEDTEFINLDFKINLGYKIFKLENNKGIIGFLNAGVFGVFHNKFDLLETSLGEFLESEKNICIYWGSE